MEFIFRSTSCDIGSLQPQLSLVLEKRVEMVMREKNLKLWALTDKLNAKRAPDEVLKKRHARYKIYGIILLIMGVLLLLMGALAPEKLYLVLFMGLFILSMGIGYLGYGRKKKRPPDAFDNMARELLGKQRDEGETCFTEEGMSIAGEEIIPFAQLQSVFQTEDLFIFTWGGQVRVLQKQDLLTETTERFQDFLSAQITMSERLITLETDRNDF